MDLQALSGKVEAIVKAQDVNKLRAFLGLINCYGKFIRKLSSPAQPLDLLCKGFDGSGILCA